MSRSWSRSAAWALLATLGAAAGCFRITAYKVAGERYTSRTEADAAIQKIIERQERKAKPAATTLPHPLVFVMPTRSYVEARLGFGLRGVLKGAEIKDFHVTGTQKVVESAARMFEASRLFQRTDVVQATVDNGQGEQLAPKNAFEVRYGPGTKGGKETGFLLFGPGGAGPAFIPNASLPRWAAEGWGPVARQAQALLGGPAKDAK